MTAELATGSFPTLALLSHPFIFHQIELEEIEVKKYWFFIRAKKI
jgi:hypothetical protein